jgi:hypothetical protein
MDADRQYQDATISTASDLKTIATSTALRKLTPLTLPQVEEVVKRVADVVPAGNVPGIILHGLSKLRSRQPPAEIVRRDVNLLFQGVEQTLDNAVCAALFAGPAAVIWGYQNLLKLVGKNPDDAFPEGTWQFYVDYALREDTARHSNETHGFDTVLNYHQVKLSQVDRITAWAMTAIHCLHQYNDLLANEWRERVMLYLLREEMPSEPRHAGLYRAWEKQRPYGRGPDSPPNETYPQYRWRVFDRFVEQAAHDLPRKARQQWLDRLRDAEADDLPAYQRQMSILSYLDPGPYGETRTPVALKDAQLGVIWGGCYHLLPVCRPGTDRPAKVSDVRALVAALLAQPPGPANTSLTDLAELRRGALLNVRKKLDRGLNQQLDQFKTAPVLLNFDARPRYLPLSDLRQAERGIGDHALTVFDTGSTFIFDQSHIFFDGAWGAALAEILTNEALAWAAYLHTLPAAEPSAERPAVLALRFQPAELEMIREAPRVTPHVSAESNRVDLNAILTLRKLLHARSDLLQLTVNDLLVLYRAIHAVTYIPDSTIIADLKRLARRKTERPAAESALAALDPDQQAGAAILIPVDASQRQPRDRLFPITFEVPLAELDLLALHRQVLAALEAWEGPNQPKTAKARAARLEQFRALQRHYLTALAGFGMLFSRAKEIALTGKSASVGTIKMLAHIPTPVQRLLDRLPARFDMLNDMIKGREVFSNVGAVVPSSTLTRFTTAKDDNEKKTLVWGVITDATGTMHISLRDFRPHVALLMQVNQRELAARIAQDYLDAYVRGLNNFISDLQRITVASRDMPIPFNDLP